MVDLRDRLLKAIRLDFPYNGAMPASVPKHFFSFATIIKFYCRNTLPSFVPFTNPLPQHHLNMSAPQNESDVQAQDRGLPPYSPDPVLPAYEEDTSEIAWPYHAFFHYTASADSTTLPNPRPANPQTPEYRLHRALAMHQRTHERDLELGNIEREDERDLSTRSDLTASTYPSVPASIHVPAESSPRHRQIMSLTPAVLTTAQAIDALNAPRPASAAPFPASQAALTRASRTQLENAATASREDRLPPARCYSSHRVSAPAQLSTCAGGTGPRVTRRVNRMKLTGCSLLVGMMVLMVFAVVIAVLEMTGRPIH